MKNVIVAIDAQRIVDSASFHTTFWEALGFPESYGRNMDAWVDCMSSLDVPEDRMSKVHVAPGHFVVLQIENARDFAARCPTLYADLVECSAFVNWRLIERGHEPLLALSFGA